MTAGKRQQDQFIVPRDEGETLAVLITGQAYKVSGDDSIELSCAVLGCC